MKDIHLVYLGHFVNEDMLGTFCGPAVSGNRMHIGLLNALRNVVKLEPVSVMPIATYPNEKKIRIKETEKKLKSGLTYKQIKFTNLFIIKHITQICSVYRELKKSNCKKEKSIIMNFNPYMELAIPTLLFSKIHKIKTVCVVADIPTTVPTSYSFLKKLLRKLEIKLYYHFVSSYDGLVVLNENIIPTFSVKKPYYLMDGGVSDEEVANTHLLPADEHKWNQIVYTGALEPYNGISQLLSAFSMVKNVNLKLIICGDGTMRDAVIIAAKNDNRIVYEGKIPNQEAKKLQCESGLLISTRPADLFEMRLTFPSKIIEYMLSGTPVLSTQLNGLSEEYQDCMFFTGQNPEEIAEKIEQVYSLPAEQRFLRAQKAYTYVVEKKTYKYHCGGIADLLEEVLDL